MSPAFKPDPRDQLLLALEKANSLDAIDCEYWPGPDEADEPKTLFDYIKNYLIDPTLHEKVEAVRAMLAASGYHVGDPSHQNHSHAYYKRSATAEQQAALKSIARGDTVEEWNIIRNRLNPNQSYPREDRTKRKHNKHLGKGKRKR